MRGRFQDSWQFMWPEVWLRLEETNETPLEIYNDLYVELVKAYRKAPTGREFDTVANDATFARRALETVSAADLRGEDSIARFLENAYEVLVETGHPELPRVYQELVAQFLESRNLRYELVKPFQIKPNLSGVFSALMSDVMAGMQGNPDLVEAATEFEHAFGALTLSHSEPDIKTCIQKAAMLVEAIASVYPNAQGSSLGELCDSIKCWPHTSVKDAMKKLYGFCSDYPGIRHNVGRRGRLRTLEMRDSVIIPLLLLTASGYFGSNTDLMATLRSQTSEPDQIPADKPAIDLTNPDQNLP
jgi:hypothetical protein